MVVASSVLATRLNGAIAHRTWSIAGSERDPRFHLFLLRTGRGALTRAASPRAAPPGIELRAPSLLWLPHATRATFQVMAGGDGFSVSAARDFVQRIVAGATLTAPLRPLLDQLVIAGPEALAGRVSAVAASCDALVDETRDLQPGAAAMIGLHMGLLLVQLWRGAGLHGTAGARGTGGSTAQRFRQLVDLHYREGLRIDEFADRLGVTRAHLHDSCLRAAGRTPLALLHDRLLEEARARLEQTDLTVEQVGYGIGFRDPAYFSRFFKRLIGQSPGAYRRGAAAARARPAAPSFAAWP